MREQAGAVPFLPGLKTIGDGRYYTDDPDSVYHAKLFSKLKKTSMETKEQVEAIAQEWKSIQEIFDHAASHVKKSWLDARDDCPRWLADIRNIRMSLSVELKQIQQAVKDIDEATNGDAAIKRRQQLAELVDLCERFRAVQKDGTFDAVVDALLKH